MQQSVIYQEWKEEGRQEGHQEGRQEGKLEGHQEGKLEGEQSLILRLLVRRIGDITPNLQSQIQCLSLNQLESLGDALLDFSHSDDLVVWLRTFGA